MPMNVQLQNAEWPVLPNGMYGLYTSPICLSLIMVIATSVVNIMGTQCSGIYGSAHEGCGGVDRVDPWNSVFPQ
jgi:hypothetical protein